MGVLSISSQRSTEKRPEKVQVEVSSPPCSSINTRTSALALALRLMIYRLDAHESHGVSHQDSYNTPDGSLKLSHGAKPTFARQDHHAYPAFALLAKTTSAPISIAPSLPSGELQKVQAIPGLGKAAGRAHNFYIECIPKIQPLPTPSCRAALSAPPRMLWGS